MDDRPYFALGDLLANLVTGALVGLACATLIGPGWNMWLAMVLGMALGMVLALLLWLPFGHFFGAVEVMLPLMLGGMIAGMVVGMSAAMADLPSAIHLVTGAFCGLLCLNLVWLLNLRLRGEQS